MTGYVEWVFLSGNSEGAAFSPRHQMEFAHASYESSGDWLNVFQTQTLRGRSGDRKSKPAPT